MKIKIATMINLAWLAMMASIAGAGNVGTVGIFKDGSSYGVEGVAKTLEKEGFKTRVLTPKDLGDPANLDGLDAIYLPAGWNGTISGSNGRMNLIDFVARGKGVLAGAFRSGWFRTSTRPLFPQVGYTWSKNNGLLILPRGDSELAKAFDGPYPVANWDHVIARVGPEGSVFAVDSGGNPVGICGNVYGGRYIVFGDFFHLDKEEMEDGIRKRVFLACITWLSHAPQRPEQEMAKSRAVAEEEFLRREFTYNWVNDEPGPDTTPGMIPDVKYQLVFPLQLLKCRLAYAGENAGDKDKSRFAIPAAKLDETIQAIERRSKILAGRKGAEIASMTLEDLKAGYPVFTDKVAVEQIRKELKEATFSGQELKPLTEEVETLLAKVEPDILAQKQKQWELDRREDLKSVVGLMEQLSAKDEKTRLKAVAELGRIGNEKAARPLIKALNDESVEVRIGAIQALAWMQAKEAVPALIELSANNDTGIRRRAAQALGQIGDSRADPALLKLLNDPDHHVKQNAMFALGWLKSEPAVPELMERIKKGNVEDPYQRDLMATAVRALGSIGDKRALPLLKDLAEKANDYPGEANWRPGKHKNFYALGTSLGLQGLAEQAIKQVEAGGIKEQGVRQLADLSRRTKFYGLRENFNFFAGRPFCPRADIRQFFRENPNSLFAFVRSLGATGIHNAWDISTGQWEPEEYRQILRQAGRYDLKWIDTMPSINNGVFHAPKYKTFKHNGSLLCKPTAEFVLRAYDDVPAFQGFWFEEVWPGIAMADTNMQAKFQGYLNKKYGAEVEKETSWKPGAPVERAKDISSDREKRLWADFLTAAGDSLIEEWRESQEWLRGVRKGCALTFSESEGVPFTYIGDHGRAGAAIEGFGPESYLSFDPNSTLMMELAKDGTARPVMCEFYNWYDPSLRHAKLGFAKQLMHGECFYNFALEQIMDHPAVPYLYYWKKGIQKHVEDIFLKARKTSAFLSGAESAANVALVASERTELLFYSLRAGSEASATGPAWSRYYQQLLALWEMLRQLGVPADAIWTETLTPQKIARYRVLLLPDAKSLTSEQTQVLREWVKNGGTLIATGSTSLFDEHGIQGGNYTLSDVFGVSYKGHKVVSNPDDVDTYCFMPKKYPFKVVGEGFDRENLFRPVIREAKPKKETEPHAVTGESDLLPGIPARFACEYDVPLGYDLVTPADAKTLAQWKDGSSALTVNEFGQGLGYFWSPIYPGLCHTIGDIVYTPCEYKFWPGVKNMLGAMIRGGLKHGKAALPAEVISGPSEEVEVVVRTQPDKRRWMIHVLNCNPRLELVKGLNLIVRPPQTEKLNVFYPDTGETIAFTGSAGGIAFTVRDFDVHEMMVVAY
ncbi:MAG: HEAT repeat domain-containing protein [Kiritimatiellae bacterium]|nr:HEAT repeat domain-containing protein [Kiritimatiellia bacterium]